MDTTKKRIYPPIHPGRVLELEFLEPLGMSPYRLAQEIGVPVQRAYDLVRCRRGISADTALRLARYFGNSARFWTNLQARYDLESAKDRAGEAIEREVRPREARSA